MPYLDTTSSRYVFVSVGSNGIKAMVDSYISLCHTNRIILVKRMEGHCWVNKDVGVLFGYY